MTIIEDRLEELLDHIILRSGKHQLFEDGVCVMEAAAWIAGEPHSDHPKCVSPMITEFMVSWNDSLPDDETRDRLLKPLLPLLIGTRTTESDEVVRGYLVIDWFVRVHLPSWLRLAGLGDHASVIAGWAAITNLEELQSHTEELSAARSAAWSAAERAWSAARSAAESAAWSAARSAARSAAESAAESAARSAAESAARSAARSEAWCAAQSAAWSAARSAAESAAESAAQSAALSAAESAARSAARSAAWSAAWSAAESALQLTVTELQVSAQELVVSLTNVGRRVPRKSPINLRWES